MNPKNPNFRTSEEWSEVCERLVTELADARKEIDEQCRLNGMGGERELKLMAELARYKSDLAVANACALANVRDVPIAQELEQTKDYNKFLSEQLAANASSRSYFENECRKLEHELAAAKHRIETWHKPDQLLLEKERDEARGELIAAKGEIEQLTRERAKVSSKGNIAYLWFAGKDGWQVTSFHPKDEPAIGFKESKMYVNYDAFAELDAELAAAKGEINRLTEKCETLFMKGQEVVSELAAAKGEIERLTNGK